MLHNDAAQQRPGKKPASAPEASQKPPRAQGRANLKILTLKRISSRPGDTTVASLTDGNMETPHIIHIHGLAGTARRHEWTLRPMQLNPHCSNYVARQKSCGKSPSSWPCLHDTIPSGKDTSKPARSTKKSRSTLRLQQLLNTRAPHRWNPPTGQWRLRGGGKGNNFMHGMARPAGDLKLYHHSH